MKILQTKRQVKSKNVNFYHLYYFAIENSTEKEDTETFDISEDLLQAF